MGYLVDRQRAVLGADVVAVLAVRQRGARSRLILSDNSLCHTLTRPSTVMRAVNASRRREAAAAGAAQAIGVAWWIPS